MQIKIFMIWLDIEASDLIACIIISNDIDVLINIVLFRKGNDILIGIFHVVDIPDNVTSAACALLC